MKNEQTQKLYEMRINELYIQAFEKIKENFKGPAALIKWTAFVTEDLYCFSRNFKFIGSDKDFDIDEIFLFYYFHALGVAWFEDDMNGVKDALTNLLNLGGAERFYHSISKALAVRSWNKTSSGIEPLKEFTESFVCLVDVAIIFEQIEELEEEMREMRRRGEKVL